MFAAFRSSQDAALAFLQSLVLLWLSRIRRTDEGLTVLSLLPVGFGVCLVFTFLLVLASLPAAVAVLEAVLEV